jgi:hypothetical protein
VEPAAGPLAGHLGRRGLDLDWKRWQLAQRAIGLDQAETGAEIEARVESLGRRVIHVDGRSLEHVVDVVWADQRIQVLQQGGDPGGMRCGRRGPEEVWKTGRVGVTAAEERGVGSIRRRDGRLRADLRCGQALPEVSNRTGTPPAEEKLSMSGGNVPKLGVCRYSTAPTPSPP